MDLKIKQEIKGDFREVYELNALAFGQENETKLVDLLQDSDAFVPELSLVATTGSNVVGHILFTKIKIIDDRQNAFDSLTLAIAMTVHPNTSPQTYLHTTKTATSILDPLNLKGLKVVRRPHILEIYEERDTFRAGLLDSWSCLNKEDMPHLEYTNFECLNK